MRRIASSVVALAMVISTAMPVPVEALEYAYLFILQTEIEGRGQAPPLQGEDPGAIERRRTDEKAEFDRLCGQVQNAPNLTVEELEQLIEDCAALTQRLEQSENPQAKIWIQRLKMCRDFFEYSIDVMAEE
jgi:hypothetical protein